MNTGPHPVDQALQLFGGDELPQISCIMDRTNTFGDAEDYVKLLMRGPGRPTFDLEISSSSAFPHEQFNIQGTNGGLHGSGDKRNGNFLPEQAPEQKLIREPLFTSDGTPAYCKETLPWQTDSWEAAILNGKSAFEYMTETLYLMMYATLTEAKELESHRCRSAVSYG